MKYRILLILTLVGLTSAAAQAQQMHTLKCQGMIYGQQAVLEGRRAYMRASSSGDGDFVRFQGMIRSAQGTANFAYEGYVLTAPFPGMIQMPQGSYWVKVLDNTGGKMIIYSGQERLGPPDIVGQFVCSWH